MQISINNLIDGLDRQDLLTKAQLMFGRYAGTVTEIAISFAIKESGLSGQEYIASLNIAFCNKPSLQISQSADTPLQAFLSASKRAKRAIDRQLL